MLNQEHHKPDPRPTSPRLPLFAAVIVVPFLLLACPGKKTNTNSGNSPEKPSPARAVFSFDGDRAFDYVRKQVEFGPRPAGSVQLAATRNFIVTEFKSFGLNVSVDEFSPSTPQGTKKMANVIAELPGESSEVIMISSHYDTKLFDNFRFVGANDGGSSTAVVMELARSLASRQVKLKFTYWFVLFDGEEAFCGDWDECGKEGAPDNTYGSRRFVSQLEAKSQVRRVRAMILLDLVGYKNLQLPRESYSSSWLVDTIWQTARELGHGAVFLNTSEQIEDDHVGFLKVGIEAVDLIQLNSYEYWHTEEDTLDKISPRSLKIVGDVVLASLPKIEQRIR